METPEVVVSESSKEAIESKVSDIPAENAEQKPVETPEPVKADGEVEKPEEKKPEEENSVIRQMRKTLRTQQKQIAELRQAQLQVAQPELVKENFANEADYIKAVVNQTIQQTPKAQTVYDEKLSEAARNHPDFKETIHNTDHIDFGDRAPVFVEAIENLTYGSDVLYHLSKNPEIAEELALLPAGALAARIGDIHGDIRQSKTTKQVSRAPAPITPVSGAASKVDKSYDDITDQGEFLARRRKEKEAYRKSRFGIT